MNFPNDQNTQNRNLPTSAHHIHNGSNSHMIHDMFATGTNASTTLNNSSNGSIDDLFGELKTPAPTIPVSEDELDFEGNYATNSNNDQDVHRSTRRNRTEQKHSVLSDDTAAPAVYTVPATQSASASTADIQTRLSSSWPTNNEKDANAAFYIPGITRRGVWIDQEEDDDYLGGDSESSVATSRTATEVLSRSHKKHGSVPSAGRRRRSSTGMTSAYGMEQSLGHSTHTDLQRSKHSRKSSRRRKVSRSNSDSASVRTSKSRTKKGKKKSKVKERKEHPQVSGTELPEPPSKGGVDHQNLQDDLQSNQDRYLSDAQSSLSRRNDELLQMLDMKSSSSQSRKLKRSLSSRRPKEPNEKSSVSSLLNSKQRSSSLTALEQYDRRSRKSNQKSESQTSLRSRDTKHKGPAGSCSSSSCSRESKRKSRKKNHKKTTAITTGSSKNDEYDGDKESTSEARHHIGRDNSQTTTPTTKHTERTNNKATSAVVASQTGSMKKEIPLQIALDIYQATQLIKRAKEAVEEHSISSASISEAMSTHTVQQRVAAMSIDGEAAETTSSTTANSTGTGSSGNRNGLRPQCVITGCDAW